MPEVQRKPRILWISDSVSLDCVGQSRVSREFCSRLSRYVEIIHAGFLHESPYTDGKTFPYPCINVSRKDLPKQLPQVVKQVQPDIVLYSHDAFLVAEASMALKTECPQVRQVGYFTIDGEPVYPRWRELFEWMEAVIVPSRYGQRVIEETWADMNTTVIPYGVDRNAYRPPNVIQRNDLKKHVDEFFRVNLQAKTKVAKFHDNFCVSVVGMNQARKNLGAIHLAWREFSKRHDDICLFLLTHSQSPNSQMGTYDLNAFTDMKNSLIMYTSLPEEVYVRIFVSCDCFLHPTIGEGFGLPVLEALSSGVVPLVTNFSAVTDFCNEENSYLLPWVPLVGEYNTIRAIVTHEGLLAQLEQAYQDWKSGKLQQKAAAGVKMAEGYSWDRSALAMASKLGQVLAKPPGYQYCTVKRVL